MGKRQNRLVLDVFLFPAVSVWHGSSVSLDLSKLYPTENKQQESSNISLLWSGDLLQNPPATLQSPPRPRIPKVHLTRAVVLPLLESFHRSGGRRPPTGPDRLVESLATGSCTLVLEASRNPPFEVTLGNELARVLQVRYLSELAHAGAPLVCDRPLLVTESSDIATSSCAAMQANQTTGLGRHTKGTLCFLLLCTWAPGATACSSGISPGWEIQDPASATMLAEALANCSGGAFDVQWRGTTSVNQTISVQDGTTLRITGIGVDAEMDGRGDTQLISIRNASLHVRNMRLSRGNATQGGAVRAVSSHLVFDQVLLTDNAATLGGALYALNSTIWWSGESRFTRNIASVNGGAVFASTNSDLMWRGNATFGDNGCRPDAGCNGGALFVALGSNVSWEAETSFLGNTAEAGGAVVVINTGSSAKWEAESSFDGNTAASDSGGAVFVGDGATAVWEANAYFSDNSALGSGGGAVMVAQGASATWDANASFSGNTATFGGAVIVFNVSRAMWTREASFSNNFAAGVGGASYAGYGSRMSWTAEVLFTNNTAGSGGAVFLHDSSTASWAAEAIFSGNTAVDKAGATCAQSGSKFFWAAEAHFFGNTADAGGAVSLHGSSTARWEAEALFSRNTAGNSGGATHAVDGSSLSWAGAASFVGNTANTSAGAVFVYNASSAVWSGEALFNGNVADNHAGGAVAAMEADCFWAAKTTFSGNNAVWGGAVSALNASRVSWSGDTLFINNTVDDSGGAVVIAFNSFATLSGRTEFTLNHAGSAGGAVGTQDVDVADLASSLNISGPTVFTDNSCGANGGAIALGDALRVEFETHNVTFSRNVADVSGGAMFISGLDGGLQINNVTFISNIAEVGGAVYSTGTGVALMTHEGYRMKNPITIAGCKFIGNEARSTGGAMESAAGVHVVADTSFIGNTAGAGGALRLAGTTVLDTCLFEDNISAEDMGPAVSNIGFLATMADNSFVDNVFACDEGDFLDYNEVSSERK